MSVFFKFSSFVFLVRLCQLIYNQLYLPMTLSLLELSISSELVETLQEYIPPWALLTLVSWNIITELELTNGCRLSKYFVSNS